MVAITTPEQWLKTPEVIDKDIELMKEARCNVVSFRNVFLGKFRTTRGCV